MPAKPTTTSTANQELLHYLLEGNRQAASGVIHDMTNKNIPVMDIYEQSLKTTLYRIGELWENNEITVAEEHVATSITEAIMNELYYKIVSRTRKPYNVVLGCVETEQHQVGIKMVADVFEMKGWDTWFPGANIPVDDLIRFTKEKQPDMIALSASIHAHMPIMEKMLKAIHQHFTLPVLVGGQAFLHGGQEITKQFPRTTYIANLQELASHIDQVTDE
ncbi:MAG: cobalamin-dependent protein [Bacteroidales bacterium]